MNQRKEKRIECRILFFTDDALSFHNFKASRNKTKYNPYPNFLGFSFNSFYQNFYISLEKPG